jgi:iron complex transport system substrate-binding protein
MGEPQRIVSLLASGTELVCALGLGDRLVGRSHECDHPAWVTRLPAVSRPTFDVTGSSQEIDRLVRGRLAAGEPLYEIDERLLAELAPDVILTQTHCEVCAVSPADLAHGLAPGLVREQVVALEAGTMDGILQGFRDVAAVLGRSAEGDALALAMRRRVERVADRTRGAPRRTVVCLEWIDPLFAMSNWGPELVEAAGGTPLLATPGAHSTTTTWEALERADPEIIIVAPCGFVLERTLRAMPALAAGPTWSTLRAVHARRVFAADGNLFFNRSGPAVFETAEILGEMLHPELFSPRHHGSAWRRWPVDRALGSSAEE